MMNPNIVNIEQLPKSTLNPELKEQLESIEWRIETNKYIELMTANVGEKIEAVGISWSNKFHPKGKYIQIISSEPQPVLLNALIQKVEPFEHVIYSCDSTEQKMISLLEEAGFQLFRKTYEERYSLNLLQDALVGTENTVNTVALAEILANPEKEEQLFRLVKYFYEQFHLDNPVCEEPWENWRELLLTDEVKVDEQLSKVAIRDGEIVGYMFVHPTSNTNAEIGWMGKSKDVSLFALLADVLQALKAAGYETVDVEIDTTNLISYELAGLLELTKKESWNSYKYV